jgi:hypothetical protein
MTDRKALREGFEPRLKGRLSAGLILGVLVGGGFGLIVGLFVFERRPGAIAACVLGGVIAGLLYGTLIGSFAGLESPDPGTEPSETEHPLSEPAIEEEVGPDLSGERRPNGDTP